MVHITEGGRLNDHWEGARLQSRQVLAVLMLVGMTAATALIACGTLHWNRVGIAILWSAITILAAVEFLRRRRVARFGRAEARPGEVPVVIRHDGREVQDDARRHRRFVPARRATTLHMRDGRQLAARIVDISIAGVAIEARLTDADFIAVDKVGTRAAGPVRRTPKGAVFGFDTLLDPQPFDASFVL